MGYDKTNDNWKYLNFLGLCWAKWVDDHYHEYDDLLDEGERLVFENGILQHTLKYNFKNEDPVFLIDYFDANNKKYCFKDIIDISKEYNIRHVPLLNIGIPMKPEIILNNYPKGVAGCTSDMEGIVYKYEHNNIPECTAKYVSNKIMGTVDPMPQKFNKFKYRLFE